METEPRESTKEIKDMFLSQEERDLLHDLKNRKEAVEAGFRLLLQENPNINKAELIQDMTGVLNEILEIQAKLNLKEPEGGQIARWFKQLSTYLNN